MLEELHGAPTGTVLGYRPEAGTWTPVLAETPTERLAYETVTRPFQEGTLEAIRSLFNSGWDGPLQLADLTPEAAVAALRAILLSPTSREVALLGGLVHCRSTDHAAPVTVVAPAAPGTDLHILQETLNQRSWPVGVLCGWRDAIDGPSRAEIQAIAQNMLHSLPERCLRQFT